MNKFLKKLFTSKGDLHRHKESPLIQRFEPTEHLEFIPPKMQTLYRMSFDFKQEIWLNDNQENKPLILMELRYMVARRLHQEIFGDIEGYLHELQLHLHNEDYEASKQTVNLIKAAIKGD